MSEQVETNARQVSVDWVTTAAGDRFRLRGWRCPVASDRLLLIHHGLGEHGGRYATFAEHLADVPIHLWTYDARGHGASSGKRGHAAGIDELAGDLQRLLPELLDRSGASRIVLFGHSMGAAVVGQYLTTRPAHEAIEEVWLSAAPVHVDLSTWPVRIKASAARILNRITPRLTLGSGLSPEGISSLPSEIERYRSDPEIHDRISASLGLSLLRDAPRLLETAPRIELPIRMWHGADDPIAIPQGSRELFERIGSDDKQLEIFEGARHEVHHERPEIVTALFSTLRTWLEERAAPC
ncbi:MAG TPA: alpha/beta hydrolase [Deltaproteobacteria bacterium]|nr:alpha/beta hydrolase [Deltaproteobacteria bacterium]